MNLDTVVIRRWRRRYGPNGSLIALFPYQPEGPGLVNSYEAVGAHGSADYSHVISLTKPSFPYEDTSGDPAYDFDALLNELRTIGYEPVARQRRARR